MENLRRITVPTNSAAAALATAAVLVACCVGMTNASAQNPGVPTLPSSGSPAAPSAQSIGGGEWTGKYICAQGATGARLILSQDGSRALFHFYALPENPGVPEGCFSMSGTFEASTRKLSLKAGKWIVRPRNFVTVNISGSVDEAGQNFSGRLGGAYGCTNIFLSHEVSSRPLPTACARAIP